MTALLVLVGAAVGAPSRWLLDQAVQSRHRGNFPLGTLLINIAGSFLLGMVLGATPAGGGLIALAGTGFCGGFTTFSTFGYETLRLAEQRQYGRALTNVSLSVGVGLLAAFVGWASTHG